MFVKFQSIRKSIQQVSFDFFIDLSEINNTRSRHEGAISMPASVAKGGRHATTVTKKLGGHHHGPLNSGIVFSRMPIDGDDAAVFTYVIINNGLADDSLLETECSQMLPRVSQKGELMWRQA